MKIWPDIRILLKKIMSLPFPRIEYIKIKYLINAHNLDFYPSVISHSNIVKISIFKNNILWLFWLWNISALAKSLLWVSYIIWMAPNDSHSREIYSVCRGLSAVSKVLQGWRSILDSFNVCVNVCVWGQRRHFFVCLSVTTVW